MENKPDGYTFTFFNKKDVKCAVEGCDRTKKHVDRYYLFKWGDKKLCKFHAHEKRII